MHVSGVSGLFQLDGCFRIVLSAIQIHAATIRRVAGVTTGQQRPK